MPLELNAEALRAAKFRGPTIFRDGAEGMAQQDFECVDEPRFGYFWRRENRQDRGRQAYTVDGKEVSDLDEACRLLALPPDPESPREAMRRHIDEFKDSPPLNYGGTRALSEARCNADAGPFGMVRAWMHRADYAWHRGINMFADSERAAKQEWPSWLYRVKSSAHEVSRGMYLFALDAKADTDLRCSLGKRCRDCHILSFVDRGFDEVRDPERLEQTDRHAAKVWTCVGHVLTENPETMIDGAVFSTTESRKSIF